MRENWHGRYPRTSPGVIAQMVELYEDGMTIREIASEVGVVSSTVSKHLRKAGVPKRESRKRKKMSLEQRKEVASRYGLGDTISKLEKEYGVSSTVVISCLDEFGVKHRTGWGKFKTQEWTDANGRVWVFKSRWELEYAKWLDSEGHEWDYEPCKFGLRECKCYTPDFAVHIDGKTEFHEVKGWLDEGTERRLLEFVQMYPERTLKIIGPKQMAGLSLVGSEYETHNMADVVFRFQQKLLTA